MVMDNWRAKQIAKRTKGSVTPGKTKGPSCQTSPQKKFFFTSPKAYKVPGYEQWHDRAKKQKG